MSDACAWTEDDPDADDWRTNCGKYFTLNDGTPTDNNMRFCCYCGKPLNEVRYQPESDDDQ